MMARQGPADEIRASERSAPRGREGSMIVLDSAVAERHAMMRDAARAFADGRIRPLAEELDRTEAFPRELYAEMAGLGMFGITVPEAMGGVGSAMLGDAAAMAELHRGYALND